MLICFRFFMEWPKIGTSGNLKTYGFFICTGWIPKIGTSWNLKNCGFSICTNWMLTNMRSSQVQT
jgi:hypothetical protein